MVPTPLLPPGSVDGNAWTIRGFTAQNEDYPAPTASSASSLPAWVNIVTVTGNYVDGTSGKPQGGYIWFIPQTNQVIAAGGEVISLNKVKVELVNGQLSVDLLAGDDPDITPSFLYLVKESVLGGRTYLVNVPSDQGSTIDITLLAAGNPLQ
jgi:hypothetical protein